MWKSPESKLRCVMCTTTLPQLPLSLSRLPIKNCRASSSFSDKRGNGSLHLNPKSRLSVAKCSTNEGAANANANADGFPQAQAQAQDLQGQQSNGLWSEWKVNSAEMRSKVAKLGLAAVLAYGIFDGVTYTSFFVLAFLGYEKSTGKNPAANLQALLGIVILMWTGNNITRPFRVAGAAALAPVIDKGLRKVQKYFNLPNLAYAFALVVSIIGCSCLTVVGLLILSRWGK